MLPLWDSHIQAKLIDFIPGIVCVTARRAEHVAGALTLQGCAVPRDDLGARAGHAIRARDGID